MVRLANLGARLHLLTAAGAVDVEHASGGRFAADPQLVHEDWEAFSAWAREAPTAGARPVEPSDLGPPVPRPRQVFAIGLNYAEHAAEAGYPPDALPVTFTKFPSCLTGPDAVVELPSEQVDWEVELVVVIARHTHRVPESAAWDHVAGLMVGQDLSDRPVQLAGTRPQFSLGKSYPGFGPTGPWLTTPDDVADRDDLEITATLSGETVQASRTSAMIYPVPVLLARLSAVCPLLPGDLVFTGTPAGIGNARTPKRFLRPDDVLVSSVAGLGELTTRFRAPSPTG